MAGIFGAPFWLILLSVVTAGFGGKKKDYDIALDSAIKYAMIHDLFKPLDMQEYRDDIQITEILHVPPYSKYIKKLHTAKTGKTVELKYMFQAIRDPDIPSLRKRLLCTANINEFFLDGQFYYVLPYRKNLKCEEQSEDVSDESIDDSSKKDYAIKEPEKKSLKTVLTSKTPVAITTSKTPVAITTSKTPVAITTSKTIRTTPKATRFTTTSPRSFAKTTTPRTTKKSHAATVSTESPTDIFKPLFERISKEESSAPEPIIASIVKKTIVTSPSAKVDADNDQPKLKRLGWEPEPSMDLNQGVVQFKLRHATVNLDFGGELKQDLGPFLSTNKEHIFENAVINIKVGSPDNKKQPIGSPFNETSYNSFSEDHRHYSLKDASINLNKAGLGDQIPEILPPQWLSPLKRSLRGRIKQKIRDRKQGRKQHNEAGQEAE